MTEPPADAPPPLEYATPVRRRPSWLRAVLIAGIVILAILNAAPLLDALGVPPRPPRHAHSPDQYCYRNLRIIALAVRMYANDNNDVYPPSLQDVLLTQEVTSDLFVCPGSHDTAAIAPTTQQAAAMLGSPNGHHCSYLFVGDGLTNQTVKGDDVIAFELPVNHSGMANVLFGDTHVERVTDAAQLANLQADCAAGVRPIRLRP